MPVRTPEAFFAPYPKALPLYRAVRKLLEGFGDVETIALKRGPPDLYLSFDLPKPVRSPRFKEVYEARAGCWVHHMRLAKKADLDAQVRGWLRASDEMRGLKAKRAGASDER